MSSLVTYAFVYSDMDEGSKVALTEHVPEHIHKLMEEIGIIKGLPLNLTREQKTELNGLEDKLHAWFYGNDDAAPAMDSMKTFKHMACVPGPVIFFDITVEY